MEDDGATYDQFATEVDADAYADAPRATLGAGDGRAPPLTTRQWAQVATVLVVVVVLIVVVGKLAYDACASRRDEERLGDPALPAYSRAEFFGVDQQFSSLLRRVGVGMASGVVFGLIDNGGLFVGMSYLEPLFARYLPDGNHELVKAGLGNTFSDAVGAFLGAFVGMIVQNKSRIDLYPFWAEALGVVLGCIIGVYLPWGLLRSRIRAQELAAA